MSDVETVQAIYRAFGRGEVATIIRFERQTFFDGGHKVFVPITFDAAARGKSYSFPNNGHLWVFNAAGKVVKFDHVTDTAQMIRMAKGE